MSAITMDYGCQFQVLSLGTHSELSQNERKDASKHQRVQKPSKTIFRMRSRSLETER
jgi:hypothetical protein